MSRLLASILVVAGLAGAATASMLPEAPEMDAIRGMVVQHDGRWMPLDTLARDTVRTVTGTTKWQGEDAVRVLLGWTFAPDTWMRTPIVPIRNAELRRELKLPSDREEFSYAELVSHEFLINKINELARMGQNKKPDPLQSKVADINEELLTLQSVFMGGVIRAVPNANEKLGAWSPVASDPRAGQTSPVEAEWQAVKAAFLANDRTAFEAASGTLVSKLNAMPAAYRPPAKQIATELRYSDLRPYRTAWIVMLIGAGLSAAAMVVRRKWFDFVAITGMLAGFVLLSYGLWLRWEIAGRIPASNMFESLLFLSWGMGAFAIVAMLFLRHRIVPLTASLMGAAALALSDLLPGVDPFIRPAPPVLLDTIWMSIHVPIIMVSYSVLALGVLFAHAQVVSMAVVPQRRKLIGMIDAMHYWYIHVGAILLLIGIVTGSVWAASSWGRYWGWDPKEVWSLIALLGYLAVMHVRIDQEQVPPWARGVGLVLIGAIFVVVGIKLDPLTPMKLVGLGGALVAVLLFVFARGPFATALKSIACFWLILMTYLGVNYILGIGLHSYGFGTGAMARWMITLGAVDLGFMAICSLVYGLRQKAPFTGPMAVPATA